MEFSNSMRDDTERCDDCDGVFRWPDHPHICPATCPNGVVDCPGPGVAVVSSAVCTDCRRVRRRVVLPLENR